MQTAPFCATSAAQQRRDVGGGWLIFGLPPAELAVHPSDKNDVHEFYFMCDDVEGFVAEMRDVGISCDPVRTRDTAW
jgi:hypothetical protein